MARARLLIALSALALTSVGCAGSGDDGGNAAATSAPATETATTTQGPGDPGRVLVGFVEAAHAERPAEMWALLSSPTRARLGPTLRDFRRGAAVEYEEGVGAFGSGNYELIQSEQAGSGWAVAAVAGDRTAEGMREYAAYAAALRLEDGEWKLELGSPIRIRPLVPDPGDRLAQSRTQIAAEIAADEAVGLGGLWLDGTSPPSRAGGGVKRVTIFGEVPRLTAGKHAVVAFALAGDSATALAWTFESRADATD